MKIETVVITPEKAENLLAMCPEYQRILSPLTVEEYARMMQSGKWMANSVLQISNGKLIDGQHRMQALIKSGRSFNFVILTHDAESDIERYKIVDNNRSRSFRDLSRADNSDRKWEVSEYQKTKLSAAANFIASNFRPTTVKFSSSEKLDLAFAWVKEYKMYLEILELQPDGLFEAAPYAALALMTFRYQLEKAQVFWYRVVTGETSSMDNPDARLRKYILLGGRSVKGTGGDTARANRLKTAVACWNAYYLGKQITRLSLPEMSNLKIEGIPEKS